MAEMDTTPAGGHPLVLFDGVCNLCDRSVTFLIDRDRPAKLRFASLQSSVGRSALRRAGRQLVDGASAMESLLLIEGGHVYERSTAVLRIARHLSSPFWRLTGLLLAIPRPLRDAAYGWVARNRYAWFGKTHACRLPTPDLRGRFLLDSPERVDESAGSPKDASTGDDDTLHSAEARKPAT